MKKILCLILFLSLSPLVFATDLNWSLTGTESENLILWDFVGGALSDINDNNVATFRYCSAGTGVFTGILYVEFEHEIAFSKTVAIINKIEVVTATIGASGVAGIIDFKVYLYYNSTWNLVFTGSTGLWTKKTDSQEGTWNNVSKIKLYVRGGCGGPPDSPRLVGLLDFELRAWGVDYTDIGLRVYDGSSVVKIGVQDLDGHQLRTCKDETIYGIPLLDTGSGDASAVRIWDGSAVKALPVVD